MCVRQTKKSVDNSNGERRTIGIYRLKGDLRAPERVEPYLLREFGQFVSPSVECLVD